MPVTIHLVRHAQGIHNLSRELEGTHDPPLTDLGRQQCAELKARFPYHESITRLYASPMRRTLDTCLLSFDSNKYKTKTGHGVVAMHEMQEVSEFPCDTGSEVSTLEEEFGSVVDLSRVPANWNKKSKSPSWESKLVALETRAREARLALRELLKDAKPDEHVVVVTHGAFLHFLTNDYYNIAKTRATGWQNTEYRSYHFADPSDDNAYLVETQESWFSRHRETLRPSEEVQAELKRTYHREMESVWMPKGNEP